MATDEEHEGEDVESISSLHRVYANAVKVTATYHDFQFIIGTSLYDSLVKQPHQVIVPQLVMHMSPQHVKALSIVINKNIEKYEEEFGKIPDPPTPPKKKK